MLPKISSFAISLFSKVRLWTDSVLVVDIKLSSPHYPKGSKLHPLRAKFLQVWAFFQTELSDIGYRGLSGEWDQDLGFFAKLLTLRHRQQVQISFCQLSTSQQFFVKKCQTQSLNLPILDKCRRFVYVAKQSKCRLIAIGELAYGTDISMVTALNFFFSKKGV